MFAFEAASQAALSSHELCSGWYSRRAVNPEHASNRPSRENAGESAPAGRRPRVGIVLIGGASEGGGGTGRRFARLFQYLQGADPDARACEVLLVTPPSFLDLMSRSSIEIDPDVRVVEFPPGAARPGRSLFGKLADHRDSSARLSKIAREARLDLVHIPIPHLAYAPFLLRAEDDIRTTFSMTAAVGSFDTMNWKAKLLYRLGFERAEAIDTLYTDVAARFPSYADKIHVSPCSFTDYSRFQPAAQKENVVVFAGRLEPFKNPLLFVDAVGLAAVGLRQAGWRCEMYGDGELKSQVEGRIAQRGVADLVSLDRVPDLSGPLARARVFTSLQETENYPSQVLLEAMACGNAIIATDVGDTSRLVDELVGVPLPDAQPETLARELLGLVSDSGRVDALAAQARERILEEHSVARYADYLEGFWQNALARESACPPPSTFQLGRMLAGGALGLSFR